jgi:Uma2 family endonuclease
MCPPSRGWTYQQVADADLPFDRDLVDGCPAPRGLTDLWHDQVRAGLADRLRTPMDHPLRTVVRASVLVDERNIVCPDVVVLARAGLDVFELDHLPVGAVLLIVEVVSGNSRTDDRYRKAGMYAAAGIPSYWRVERGEDGLPVVHEFRLDEEQGVYRPVAVHEGLLVTTLPFPLEIDLKQVVEL